MAFYFLPGDYIFVASYIDRKLEHTKISSVLDQFKNRRILVLGDVMVDSYMWGDVSRISPEAPVPVLAYSKSENRLGGAANVALNIHSRGAIPVICSVIGTDENGRIFKDLIRGLNLPEEGIIESPERTTTIKTRIIAGYQQLMRIDREDNHYISEETEQLLKIPSFRIGRRDHGKNRFREFGTFNRGHPV